ncbi:MAG: non-canonical purine NTP pyrophosphatase [Christensenellales bacterium]
MKKVYILINGTKSEKDKFVNKFFNNVKVLTSYEDDNLKQALNSSNEIIINCGDINLFERKKIYDVLKDYRPKIMLVAFNNNFDATLNESVAEILTIKNNNVENREQKILIASKNIGKIKIYEQIFNELNLYATNLAEINVDENVEETGSNEIENAVLKAKAYNKITNLPVMANDSGLIIDRFKAEDQPGVLVRRYCGHELTDEQLLQVYIEKLNEVGGESEAHFVVGLALIDKNGEIYTKEFNPKRHFINKPSKILKKGLPLSSLCFDPESGMYESEMTIKQRNDYEKEEMQKQKEFIKEIFC